MAGTAEDDSDLRWCLRGCAGILAWGVLVFAWFCGARLAIRSYHVACHTDLEPGDGLGLLFVMAGELIAFAVYLSVAGPIIVWRLRRRAWLSLASGVVVALAGAVLITWAFWVWEVNWLVVPTALRESCRFDDPPGWPSLVGIPR